MLKSLQTTLAASTLLFLSACSHESKEAMDTFWLRYDPVGHRRYHREKYYPHEQRMGLRLPKDYHQAP